MRLYAAKINKVIYLEYWGLYILNKVNDDNDKLS